MAKDKKKSDEEVKYVKFTMETSQRNPKNGRKQKGDPIDIVAPADSLDEDGNAESALNGEYRVG